MTDQVDTADRTNINAAVIANLERAQNNTEISLGLVQFES